MIDNNELLRLHNKLAALRLNDKLAMDEKVDSINTEMNLIKEELAAELHKAKLQRWGLLFCVAILMFKVF